MGLDPNGHCHQTLRSREMILLMKSTISRAAAALVAALCLAIASLAVGAPAAAGPAFGLADDVDYAAALWRAMVKARLAGPEERKLSLSLAAPSRTERSWNQ